MNRAGIQKYAWILVLCLLMALGGCAEQPSSTGPASVQKPPGAPEKWELPESTDSASKPEPQKDSDNWIIPSEPQISAQESPGVKPDAWSPPETVEPAEPAAPAKEPQTSWEPPEAGAEKEPAGVAAKPDAWEPPLDAPRGKSSQTPEGEQPWAVTKPAPAQPGESKSPEEAWESPQKTKPGETTESQAAPEPWAVTTPQTGASGQAKPSAEAWESPQKTKPGETTESQAAPQTWTVTTPQAGAPTQAKPSAEAWEQPTQPGAQKPAESPQDQKPWVEAAKPEPQKPEAAAGIWKPPAEPEPETAPAPSETGQTWQEKPAQKKPAPAEVEKPTTLAAAPRIDQPEVVPAPLEPPAIPAPEESPSEPPVVSEPDSGSPLPMSQDIDTVLSLAEERLEQGRYREAGYAFKESLKLKLTPEELAQSYLGLAKVSLAFEEKLLALNWLDRLLRQIPRSLRVGEALFLAAKIEFSLERYSDAAGRLRQVLSNPSVFPTEDQRVMASNSLIKALKLAGRDSEALNALITLLEQSPQPEVESRLDEVFNLALERSSKEMTPLMTRVRNPSLQQALIAAMVKVRYTEGDISGAQELLTKLLGDPLASRWHEPLQKYEDELRRARLVSPRAVGIILPLSGKFANTGLRVRAAISLGLGIFGATAAHPPTLVVKDSKSDPTVAANEVANLVRNHRVVAIIGPMGASTSLAAAQKAQELNVPLISLSPVQGVTKSGDFVFQNFFSPTEQVNALINEHQANYGEISVAVLSPDSRYGRGFVELLTKILAERGAKPVRVVYYDPKTTDMSPQIKKLAKLPPGNYKTGEKNAPRPVIDFKAIFIPDGPKRVAMLAPLLAYWDVVGVDLLGTNRWHSKSLVSLAESYLHRAIFPDAFDPDSKEPNIASFVKEFDNAMGTKPNVLDAHGYDAASLLRTLITTANPPRTREDLRAKLSSLKDVQGVCGKLTVGADRRVQKDLTLLTIREGGFAPFYRAQSQKDSPKSAPPQTP